MDAELLQTASVAWAAISAIAVMLLGVLAVSGGRSRPPGSIAFGAFAVIWGLHVLAGRWMSYVEEPLASRAHLVYLALLLPLPYLAFQFARGFAQTSFGAPAWRIGAAASIVTPLMAATLLLVAPETIYGGVTQFGGRVFPAWGPLFAPLAIFPFFLSLFVAVWALDEVRRRSATRRTVAFHALLAAGMASFAAFSSANNLAFYASDLALGQHGLSLAYFSLFLPLTIGFLALGVRATRDTWRATSTAERRPARLVALAVLVPLTWGAIEGALAYWALPRLDTVGLWRLAGVALVAYALVRWRLPELAPRSRHSVATALGVAAAATTGGLFASAMVLATPTTPLLLIGALGLPVATLSPSIHLAHRALRTGGTPELTEATLPRRIDAYRAALEASVARESVEADADFLYALRKRLGIGDEAHEALLCIARGSILAPPDALYAGYERLRLLGEGAHGRAWLARQLSDDELVVLKEPREQHAGAKHELSRQAARTQRLNSPHLVRTRKSVETPAGSFLVLDYMVGGPLEERLRAPLPVAEALAHAGDVLRGLEALHAAGIVHGDVKASNVLLDEMGRARLCDFGAIRIVNAEVTRTAPHLHGTLSAMAPEQLDAAPSPAADVYAAGALLYRLLTGQHYIDFRGMDDGRARAAIRSGPPRLPHSRVAPAIEAILQRALAKDPSARFASARDMREALDAFSRLDGE